jgi:hypothetical protein
MMNGSLSPAGDRHPGEILHDDQVHGRRWTEKAEESSQAMAWVQGEEGWQAVVRVEVTGGPERIRVTLFGEDGAFLESTVLTPPKEPEMPDAEEPQVLE